MKPVLIAGAGIIGLATALELALRGVEVTVLERGTPMREASWAAAGMLAASDPENPAALSPLSHFSLSLYPEFLRRVEELSGEHVPLRTSQTLQVCRPEHTPPDARLLSSAEARERVPGLHPEMEGNLLWLQESSLDPRDLCRALPAAVRAAGVRIIENCPLDSVEAAASYGADAVIVCCGAWSFQNRLTSTDQDVRLCLPRKGQMIAVRMPRSAAAPTLETVLRSADVYLVPRKNPTDPTSTDAGRIIIGATVENAGFDRTPTANATAWLIEKAATLWPPIRDAKVEDVWTGIRPGTVDGLPYIGSASAGSPKCPGVWVATGHYRNGILLAPGTARVVADSVLAKSTEGAAVDLSRFRLSRHASYFADTPVRDEEPQGILQ